MMFAAATAAFVSMLWVPAVLVLFVSFALFSIFVRFVFLLIFVLFMSFIFFAIFMVFMRFSIFPIFMLFVSVMMSMRVFEMWCRFWDLRRLLRGKWNVWLIFERNNCDRISLGVLRMTGSRLFRAIFRISFKFWF